MDMRLRHLRRGHRVAAAGGSGSQKKSSTEFGLRHLRRGNCLASAATFEWGAC